MPQFAPENIFKATDSRLQTPTNVIFNRLAKQRPLTPLDEQLRANFTSLDVRLQYLTFGPDVIANCLFCRPEEPSSYFYYALPAILAPHILHIAVLGIVTSSFLSGSEGSRWRVQATIAGVALAVVDAWMIGAYNKNENAGAARARDMTHFFWNMRIYRGLAVAATDGALGWALWLTSTNRWLSSGPSVSERLEGSTRALERIHAMLKALGSIKNGVVRDQELRARNESYWTYEGEITREIVEEREIVDATQGALSGLDIQDVSAKATQFTNMIFDGLQNGGQRAAT